MKSLGEELRGRRLKAGLTHTDVFRKLRISIDFLQAVEDGAWEKLPAMTYSIGFMKTYCMYLHVAPEPYVDALLARERAPRPRLGFATPANAGTRPAWLNEILMWTAITAMVLIGWAAYAAVARPGSTQAPGSVQAETIDSRVTPSSDLGF